MTMVGRRSLREIVELRTDGSRDLPEVAAAVCGGVQARIPFAFGCFAAIDPSTGLISWAYKSHPLEIGDEEFAAAEYGGPDVNLFSEIAARPEPVGVLSVDTDGALDSCRRFREFLAPRFGFTDELRVVFRASGLTWGALAIYRGAGEPAFTADDARAVVSVRSLVADRIQRALFQPRPASPSAAVGPTVIVVDEADRVVNMTPTAEARIDELGGWDNGSLPSTVLVAVATARRAPELAVTRAVGRDGSWLVVRAQTFAATPSTDRPRADVVVTIDVAGPSDVSSLALSARGLTSREQDVARLVLQGAATKAIAETLHLSPHTVQDHLKSIFAKLGVNSRREMVQQLVLA